jgi:hypothetical protein
MNRAEELRIPTARMIHPGSDGDSGWINQPIIVDDEPYLVLWVDTQPEPGAQAGCRFRLHHPGTVDEEQTAPEIRHVGHRSRNSPTIAQGVPQG